MVFAIFMVLALCSFHTVVEGYSFLVKESHPIPTKWRRGGSAPESHILKLRVGLKQGNFAELERRLGQGMRHSLASSYLY